MIHHSSSFPPPHLLILFVALSLVLSSSRAPALPPHAHRLILTPYDYSKDALYNPVTRALMAKIQFSHGGASYDEKYPDGIPTSVVITDKAGRAFDSGTQCAVRRSQECASSK
jgi:hypothetical protein